jgi:hypothetical protein
MLMEKWGVMKRRGENRLEDNKQVQKWRVEERWKGKTNFLSEVANMLGHD